MAAATCNFMLAQCLSDLDGGLADADWRGDHLTERGRCPRTWPGKHGGSIKRRNRRAHRRGAPTVALVSERTGCS